MARALESLGKRGIEGLVVIGGNGSQGGAHDLAQRGWPVVGVASTIDNDLCGTDVTIGVDTALNIALEAIDRLKVTALSHQRGFLVETMGRNCGYLGLMAGFAGGADVIVIPEIPTDPEAVASGIAERLCARKITRVGGGGGGRSLQRRKARALIFPSTARGSSSSCA